MIRADQIPYEVKLRLRNVLSDGETDEAVAIAAALNAWPGAGRFEDVTGWDVHIELPLLIPLPQDASDE